jgi:predicted transposase/invertase (TIGR01784 family)
LTFFRNDISDETLKELMDMDEDIKKAEERLEYLSSNPETVALYKAREKALHERANMISSAKEEGKMEGKIEGKAEVARKLLSMGIDILTVIEATGLNQEEIEKIKTNLN